MLIKMGENMNKLIKFISVVLVLISANSQAQEWNKKQTEIWNVVMASYADIDKQDINWSDKWVTADAVVWGNSNPMPRTRDSVKRWDAYRFPQSKTMISEYSPTGIVVHDSTAVAHYYYSNGAKDKEGKHKTTHGRCTDILVNDKSGWKFVSWHCADEPSKD